jgi:hypothetical protein
MLRRGAALLALVTSITACRSAKSDEPAIDVLRDDITIRVRSRDRIDVDLRPRQPITLGKNTITVGFPTRTGVELVSASALMPAHGHGSPAPVIARDGDVFTIEDLVLYMSGRWELTLALRADGHEDEAIVAVDVP